jgi:serine protease AprX
MNTATARTSPASSREAGAYAAGVTSQYAGGIAPGAQLVNVRVLGDDGVGNTSDVIAGIDWVIANKGRYNIKIMNLSLGHAVTEPVPSIRCAPLWSARIARESSSWRRWECWKDADGTPVLGGIASPGNSPFAITVGATNTFGTRRAMTTGDDLLVTRPDEVRQQRAT